MPSEIELKESLEKLQKDAVEAIGEMRKVTESVKAVGAADAEKMKNIETIITKFEDAQQKAAAHTALTEKANEEFKKQIAEIEKKLYRLPTQDALAQQKESPEYKAFEKAMRYGLKHSDHQITAEEFKYLRTDVDASGGFLVPTMQVTELDKNIVEISPIRAYARIRTTTGRSLPIAIRNTLVASQMTGEGGSTTADQSAYILVDVQARKITAETAISLEELQDSSFDMEQLIKSDIVEEFARKEGAQFVNGTGAGTEMTGFMTDSAVSEINSGIADDIKWDNFVDLTDIKNGYSLTYAMKRSTAIRAQKLKDGEGRYLWQPSVEAGKPATINGLPYFIAQDMAAIGAGNYPVICGDFGRGFTIVDRIGLAFVRDELTQASNGLVRFIAHKRVGSKVTKGEAFKKLKCASA